MFKKLFVFILALFFSACAINSKNQSITRVNEVIKVQAECYEPSNSKAYEAKIKGLLYISDVGLKYCGNKRTIDKSVSLKKVYIHRVYDLNENLKYASS
ncbi:TPA: hypothetical protein R1711_001312, partial [Campylobacter lari]|nr:hypothetical protein [Campylobacter lari]